MKIAICDDNNEYINNIINDIQSLENIKAECYSYTCGEALLSECCDGKAWFDVILLDMEMDGINGIDTANRIRAIDENVIIIFITAYSEYMKESFKCQPFRFLEKPVCTDELKAVFKDVLKKLSLSRKAFLIPENKGITRLFCDDVIYCESHNHSVNICTKTGMYKVYMSLSELYEKLDKNILCRVHQSFIVNLNNVKSIRDKHILLYNTERIIPVSRAYKKDVIKEYTGFLERNMCL